MRHPACKHIEDHPAKDVMKIRTTTAIGILLAILGYLFVLSIQNLSALSKRISEPSLTWLGLVLIWLIVISLLIIVRLGESRPFSSIGFKSISGKEMLLAIGIGVILSLAVPLLTVAASYLIPSKGDVLREVAFAAPWSLILASIITAAVAEEIVFRGYLIERISEVTTKRWIGVVVSVVAFTLPHTLSWNLAHAITVVLPLGLIMSYLFLWKRNLLFNIIIHFVIDLPLVVMALIAK